MLFRSVETFRHESRCLFRPSIAFSIPNAKGNYHEFELNQISFEYNRTSREQVDSSWIPTEVSSVAKKAFAIGTRYEFIKTLLKRKTGKLKPSIGFGANPFFTYNNFDALLPISGNTRFIDIVAGFRVNVTPRLMLNLKNGWVFDLNVPLPVLIFQYSTLHSNKGNFSSMRYEAFPNYYIVRFGICKMI